MIYVLYGTEKILIDEFIKNEIDKKKINNISKYDLNENEVNDFLIDASYIDLFSEDKAIIVDNVEFLNSKSDTDTTEFEKYLLEPNEKSYLFLIVNKEKIDEKKKIVKLLRGKYKVLEFNKLKSYDVFKYIRNSFINDGYKIDNNSINRFINNIGNNTSLIYKEIEKLKIYKIDEKEIKEKDIIDVVRKEEETDIFKLVDAVLNNKKESIFKYYKDLIKSGEEPMKILTMLAGEFRILYQVKVLSEERLSSDDITNILKIHPYRVKLALGRSNNYKEEKILSLMYSLSDIDYKIKTGEADKNVVLENFFLEI